MGTPRKPVKTHQKPLKAGKARRGIIARLTEALQARAGDETRRANCIGILSETPLPPDDTKGLIELWLNAWHVAALDGEILAILPGLDAEQDNELLHWLVAPGHVQRALMREAERLGLDISNIVPAGNDLSKVGPLSVAGQADWQNSQLTAEHERVLANYGNAEKALARLSARLDTQAEVGGKGGATSTGGELLTRKERAVKKLLESLEPGAGMTANEILNKLS